MYAVSFSNTTKRTEITDATWNAAYWKPNTASDAALLASHPASAWTNHTLELDGAGNARLDGGSWTAITGWSNIGPAFDLEFMANGMQNTQYGYWDNINVSYVP